MGDVIILLHFDRLNGTKKQTHKIILIDMFLLFCFYLARSFSEFPCPDLHLDFDHDHAIRSLHFHFYLTPVLPLAAATASSCCY
jgi:hypothetical protein